jgi:methyl-accepting chemotaxis protein
MDKVTQANAANAEESASASEELSAQAEQMNGIVEQLAALVGGSAGRSTSSPARTLKTSDHAFHQIAGGASQAPAPQKTAEQSIPLGSKGDFDSFNS